MFIRIFFLIFKLFIFFSKVINTLYDNTLYNLSRFKNNELRLRFFPIHSKWISTYNFRIFPIVNPYGYTYNKRKNGHNQYGNTGFNIKEELLTPEGKIIKDAVPTRVDLFIDLHGDSNKSAFYIYERKRPNTPSLAADSLDSLSSASIPVLKDATVYREQCSKGVITQPEKDGSMDHAMFDRGSMYSLCIEIPLKAPEDQQMIGGLVLLNTVLEKFKENNELNSY